MLSVLLSHLSEEEAEVLEKKEAPVGVDRITLRSTSTPYVVPCNWESGYLIDDADGVASYSSIADIVVCQLQTTSTCIAVEVSV